MIRRPSRALGASLLRLRARAALTVLLLVAGCSAPRDPIVIDEGIITVENQTTRDWRNVKVVVNDHFGGGAPLLAAGGRLQAPLSDLQTAYGQKFDRGRQSVFKVEVTATDTDGKPVALKWGQDLAKRGGR
jgi:hypothetical protein